MRQYSKAGVGTGNAVSLYNSIYLDLYVNGGRGRESYGRKIQGQTEGLVGSITHLFT